MAGLIDGFRGHQEQKEWLLDRVKEDNLPSSLILQGPSGVGKKTLVRALLQAMNCTSESKPCGECSACLRALEEKNEFVYELKPEGKNSIGVDQVRDVHHFLSLKSLRVARFVIIDPADRLTVQAANSLLKVLEEAPEGTYFFLITEQVRGLLPTIRSRSHLLRFKKLSIDDLSSFGKFDEVALAWSDGRIKFALDLQEKENIDQLNDSLQFLYSLLCEQPQDWKKKAPWFFNKASDTRDFNFEIWHQALSKRLHGHSQGLEWVPKESGKISMIFDKLEDLRNDVLANVDKQLALENFYYQVRAADTL